MSLEDRITRLEQAAGAPSDEQRFHELVTGEYDPSMSLRDNLARAEIPPGALPPDAPAEDER